uniref:Uncharacterized protein n=1 Tax=Ixodes ricinus TaxID=34613 RepID=A0A6B0UUG2_IXORI
MLFWKVSNASSSLSKLRSFFFLGLAGLAGEVSLDSTSSAFFFFFFFSSCVEPSDVESLILSFFFFFFFFSCCGATLSSDMETVSAADSPSLPRSPSVAPPPVEEAPSSPGCFLLARPAPFRTDGVFGSSAARGRGRPVVKSSSGSR